MSKRVKKVVKLASEANLQAEVKLYLEQKDSRALPEVNSIDDCQEDMLFWSGDVD